MGNFYITATIADVSQARIAAAIGDLETFIGPTLGRFTVIYPEIMQFADAKYRDVWAKLSNSLNTSVLVTSVYNDDVLHYELWDKGTLLDQYVSDPLAMADDDYDEGWDENAEMESGPTGGDVKQLCLTYERDNPQQIEAILYSPRSAERYVFETARHTDLALALGLPAASVGSSFNYIADGELPVGLAPAQLIRLPR